VDGTTAVRTGLYCINDGGYHRWLCTMAGDKPDFSGTAELQQDVALSESVRKDSECTFGIMNRRHRVLKVPMLSTLSQLDLIFRTCGILHNMLLQFNVLDTIGEGEEDWEHIIDLADLQLQMNNNPEGLDRSAVDEKVLERDRRTKLTAVEQLFIMPSVSPVSVHTDRALVSGRQ